MLARLGDLFAAFKKLPRLLRGEGFRVLYSSEVTNNSSIDAGKVYVVRSQGHTKWAQFRCPCGCGDVILLNLSASRRPKWIVRRDIFGRATIFPSIWRTEGCRSHFFIRRGKVDWCRWQRGDPFFGGDNSLSRRRSR